MVEKRRSLADAESGPRSPDGHQRKKRTMQIGRDDGPRPAWTSGVTASAAQPSSGSDVRPMSVDLPTPPRSPVDETEEVEMEDAETQEVPQTPPPAQVGVNSGESGVGMKLDPSGSSKMLHGGAGAATGAASASTRVDMAADATLQLVPTNETLKFHHYFPVITNKARVITPALKDDAGVEWRVVWYPHGIVDDNFASVFVQMLVEDGQASVDEQEQSETTRYAEVAMVLVNQSDASGESNICKLSPVREFSREDHEFGVNKFVRRSELLKLDKSFLTTDSRVEVEIHLRFLVPEGTLETHDDVETGIATENDSTGSIGLGSEALNDVDSSTHLINGGNSIHNLLSYDSKQETGMVGLKNQGATCYLNSLLQTLFHLRAFREVVYETPTQNEDTTNSVTLALQRVFYRLQMKNKAVSTKELTRSFGWSQIDSFMQHDVQELYRILCDRLEEKMKNTYVDSTIKRLFEGKVRSFVQCINVDFQSFRDESFYDLQLDVKGCKDIYESFRKYVEIELLQGDNQYEAEGYGKQDAKKGIQFLQLPPVLNVQLKRYEYDPMRDCMAKIHDRFEFPKTLVLDEFLQAVPAADVSNDHHSPTKTKPTHIYQLHSVLVHSGDVHGGHYYVFIRPGKDISNGTDWFKFDDDQISRVDENVAIEGNFGSAPSTSNNSHPPSPLYPSLLSSPDRTTPSGKEESGLEFRSMDMPTPEDTDKSNVIDDVYDIGGSSGQSFAPGDSSGSGGLTLPLGRSFSSAYMLVYVRDGKNDISSIEDEEFTARREASNSAKDVEMNEESSDHENAAATDTNSPPVPSELLERFQKEEKAAARRKKIQQTEYLYMNLRIASDTTVASLKRYTKNLDFSQFGNTTCLRIRMKRSGSIRELHRRICKRTGVPVSRQRLWKVITRENRTHRPDQPLLPDALDQRVEWLIEDDASPKSPVRLYLQIVSSTAAASNGGAKFPKSVINRYFWSDFTPLESESDKEAGSQDPDEEEEEDDAESSALSRDADTPALSGPGCCVTPLRENDILLFVKFYDLKRELPDRLRYKGNIIIDSRKTGAQLAKYLHEALRIPMDTELVLFEEVQPNSINRLDMDTTLIGAEIQNGDIICYHYADDEIAARGGFVINPDLVVEEPDPDLDVKLVSQDEESSLDEVSHSLSTALLGNGVEPLDVGNRQGESSPHRRQRRRTVERYPDVPSYFRYLLDRVEILFQRYQHPEDKFTLELLNSNIYDEIVDAVAGHLGFTDEKRLYLRLYQHSPVTGLPKKTPLRHSQYAGDVKTTLGDFLTEFFERTHVLYYEILPTPITEIEARKQVLVYFSVYDKCFVDSNSPRMSRRMEFNVLPSHSVQDLKRLVRDNFTIEADVPLRVSEVTQNGTMIRTVLADDTSLSRFWSTGPASSDASALFVELVTAEDALVAAGSAASESAVNGSGNDDDESASESNELFYMGVVHFNFQISSPQWIHPHGVPFVVPFREQETVAQVKSRIRRRYGSYFVSF